ncbi:MAG: helix-turn-helix transcriptional regulator [Nitrospiria bacterium]
MKKRSARDLPSVDPYIRKQEKDPEVKALVDRAQLKMEIAYAVKMAREKAGLTQAELADALGITQSIIGRLEGMKDKRLPGLDLLTKISKVTRNRLVINQNNFHFDLVAK